MLLFVFACAKNIRTLTYPPSFEYISEEQLHNSMWQLAKELRAMEKILEAAHPGTHLQKEVVEHLGKMEQAVHKLHHHNTNHPLLDIHANTLFENIQRATLLAKQTPPNFIPAYQLSGACMNCHISKPSGR